MAEGNKDCREEDCAYFAWREATPSLKRNIKIFKTMDVDLILSKEELDGNNNQRM
jgi:hypothetical protein